MYKITKVVVLISNDLYFSSSMMFADPGAEVVALSPKTLMESDRYVCEICNQGFQRDQNLQMHRRRHKVCTAGFTTFFRHSTDPRLLLIKSLGTLLKRGSWERQRLAYMPADLLDIYMCSYSNGRAALNVLDKHHLFPFCRVMAEC
jgi:hypothetical protein